MKSRIRVLLPILFLVSLAALSTAQDEPAGASPAAASAADLAAVLEELPSSLETMLACALRTNPEIEVAEADVSHAQAALMHARLTVAHALVEAFQQRKLRREAVEIARDRYANMEVNRQAGRASSDVLFSLRQELAAAQAALAETESMIRALAGLEPLSGETPDSLETALSAAFQANGEIKLAVSDLARMEARRNRARLQAAEDVTITYQSRRMQLNRLAAAQKAHQKAQQLAEEGMATEEEGLAPFQSVIEAEAELARIEAHLRYLLGLGAVLR